MNKIIIKKTNNFNKQSSYRWATRDNTASSELFTTNEETFSTRVWVESDASVRPSASCDLDLWPTDLQCWPFYAFAPWTTCANLHQHRFIRFTKYRLHTL